MKLNILLIGSGGREHAIANSLYKSPSCGRLLVAPGNPGILQLAEKADIDISNFQNVIEFCLKNKIRLVVIGPEQPLADGLSDCLTGAGITVFGPSKFAAQLESSKDFSKQIMLSTGIPTASYRAFTPSEFDLAHKYIDLHNLPIVLKADGLAAGKGVVIANSHDEAHKTIDSMFGGEFGNAGSRVLVEEFMQGIEASVFVVCDGLDYLVLPPSQDHKRIGEGDTGKNTGGMGAFAPASIVTNEIMGKVENLIVKPLLQKMKSLNYEYRGCLYVGLMIENDNPRVVEFNVRFGDPETQAVLPLIKGDIAKLFYTAAIGKIEKDSVSIINDKVATCVVLSSKGYPDNYEKGFVIDLPDQINDNEFIFHAGTIKKDNSFYTNGGRVLGVVAVEDTIVQSIDSVYKLVNRISYNNMYFRNDIGKKEIG